MRGRTWKNLSPDQADQARKMLRRVGTEDPSITGPHEAWRIRVEKSVFTFYDTGTLYFAGGGGLSETVAREISTLVGLREARETRELLIGLDETGKGEVLGHAVLCAAVVRPEALASLEDILGTADTK